MSPSGNEDVVGGDLGDGEVDVDLLRVRHGAVHRAGGDLRGEHVHPLARHVAFPQDHHEPDGVAGQGEPHVAAGVGRVERQGAAGGGDVAGDLGDEPAGQVRGGDRGGDDGEPGHGGDLVGQVDPGVELAPGRRGVGGDGGDPVDLPDTR